MIRLFPPDRSNDRPIDRLQAKLTIGAIDDPLEQEADRVADQILRQPQTSISVIASPPPPRLSRKCDTCEAEDEALQTKPAEARTAAAHTAPAIVHEVVRSSAQSLAPSTRTFFETRFGRDFSTVRLHTDSQAARSAGEINARAYTVGDDIVFAANQFCPETEAGARLLAHELTHVVQQTGDGPAAIFGALSSPRAGVDRETITAANAPRIQRDTAPASNCGPGSDDPFCLGLPGQNEQCKPFDTLDHALSVWADLSGKVPLIASTATRCGEVKPVWDTYFAGTSTPFGFSDPSSCVVAAAKTDAEGAGTANRSADSHVQDIIDALPVTLRGANPSPFNLGGPIAELRLPLEDAIPAHGPLYLHPDIVYNNPFNAAANIAGAVGTSGEGSDIFGDDDRVIGGPVVIDVTAVDQASGAMSGNFRWLPHIHVKDTVDFCPGNLGNSFQRPITLPMSKLEAQGLTRDVPITIDYDLDVRQGTFTNVQPLVGPLPAPGQQPSPPTPSQPPTSGKTYVVVEGDYLIKIATDLCGDPSKWQDIYSANIATIGPDANLILPGQVLTIPCAAVP